MSENKIGLNVRTYRNVVVRDSVLCDNVLVADDSFISGCKIEENVVVERRSMLFNSRIGAYSTLGWNDVVRNAEIGKYCSIAWNCTIGGAEHFLHRLSTSFFPFEKRYGIIDEDIHDVGDPYAKPVEVGNDVWIAAGAQVLRGVKVGDGAVLGGGTILTKDVPPYEIWAGVPAKKIGQRFSDEIISELLELQWWKWPREFIKEHIKSFQINVDLELLKDLKSEAACLMTNK